MITISVVIPAYNRVHTIGEALASVRAQTRAPLEIIVVDDASTDGTAELAEMAGVRVIRLRTNRGSAAARNEGMRAAAGTVVAWLDSDDSWEPHHLEILAALLERHPEAAAAGSAIRYVGNRSGVWSGRIPEGPPSLAIREAFSDWLTPTSTTMVRRDALIAVGGFDESERYSEDFDLWLRLARAYRFVGSREITANCRFHGDQLSANPEKQWRAVYKFRHRALERIRRDGDGSLADELAALFRARWEMDVQSAWDEGRMGWLRQLVELAALVPDLSPVSRIKWSLRSRLPETRLPRFRAVMQRLRRIFHMGFESSPPPSAVADSPPSARDAPTGGERATRESHDRQPSSASKTTANPLGSRGHNQHPGGDAHGHEHRIDAR